MDASIHADAACAVHPAAQATGICGRCGAFVCDQCTGQGEHSTCPACRARTGAGAFPLSRDDWDVGRLFALSWRGFCANWLSLSAGMSLYLLVSWGLSFSTDKLQLAAEEAGEGGSILLVLLVGIAEVAIEAPLLLGLMRMAGTSVTRGRTSVAELFSQYHKLPALFGLVVIGALVVVALMAPPCVVVYQMVQTGEKGTATSLLPILLGLLPIVWLLIPLCFAQIELALNDRCGPIDAIRGALKVCLGHWFASLGTIVLAVLAACLGLAALGVGVIASAAFSNVVIVGLYLALRNGAGCEPL